MTNRQYEPSHLNIRDGGNIQYMRVTPAERMMGYLAMGMGYLAAILFTAFILSLFWNGVTVTEINL